MHRQGVTRRSLAIVGMLALGAVALVWAAAPATAGPTPQDYNPGEIFNDTYSDFPTALNVTANQSEKMEFYLDCPGVSAGEFDFMYVWVPAGMDVSFFLEVDPTAQSSFRGYLVSPEYLRLVVSTVPPAGQNETYFNTTSRIDGRYYFAADGQASCLGGALFYNVTWTATSTGAADDGDNSILNAMPVSNGTVVSSSLTETTDQADFLTTSVMINGTDTVLLRLVSASGIILTNGFQFEIYNSTGLLSTPPDLHNGLSPNSTGITLIQNGVQMRENVTLTIRMWSNGLTGSYSFTILIETYTPQDSNLDFASARALSEIPSLDGGLLNYTYEKVHFHKIFVGGPANARTLHVQVWSETINIGIRLFNEEAGTLNHLPRGSSRHNPVSNPNGPDDIEVIHHYASAANLTGETGWYYVEVTIEDDLPPDGSYAIAFYFNDRPVGTDDVGLTTPEDTPVTGYDVSSRFRDLDCDLDSGDPDCDLTLALVSSDASNVTWDFSGSPLLAVTPLANWSGSACADFTATDSYNESASARVCLTVTAVNDRPDLTGVAPATDEVPEDGSITRLVSSWFTDIDNDTLTITAAGNTMFAVTLQLTGPYVEATLVPAADWNGCENITYTATDPGALSVSHTVDTCVLPLNDAPTIRGGLPEVAVDEDAVASMDLQSVLILGTTGPAFRDVDGDGLTFRVYDLVDVDVVVSGSILTITPRANFAGLGSFSVAAYDGIVESARAPVRVRVNPVNDPPTVDAVTPSVSPVVMSEGEDKTFTVTASDIDGDPLTYTWYVDGVGQVDSNKTTFTISVPITEELARSVVVRVEVTDPAGASDESSWTVNIENTNLAPTISITAPTASTEFSTEDDITFSATASDPDGDTLTYSWTSDLVGAAIGDQQTFTGRLPAGTHTIRVVVSDGTTTNAATVSIVVKAPPTEGGPGPDALGAVVALAVVAAVALVAGSRRKR